MTAIIEIVDGIYKIRGNDTNISGMQFVLVEGYRLGTAGGFVTVEGGSANPPNNGIPDRKIRVRCEGPDSYKLVSGELPTLHTIDRSTMVSAVRTAEPEIPETDSEIMARIRSRFKVLSEMTSAVKAGNVRAMIVAGPPGLGKSFGVEEVLTRDDLFNTLGNRKPKYEIVKGTMSALGLYCKLYEFSAKDHIVVFDDCDEILMESDSLNILKGALDTGPKRVISWNTDSSKLRNDGIPNSFEFKGGAIFISNIKFENVRSKTLQLHLAALESRCHYVDMQLNTVREKMLRIKQVVADGMLDRYDFDQEVQDEVVTFVTDNRDKLRELSIRTVLKVADLRKSFPDSWKTMAKVTVLRYA